MRWIQFLALAVGALVAFACSSTADSSLRPAAPLSEPAHVVAPPAASAAPALGDAVPTVLVAEAPSVVPTQEPPVAPEACAADMVLVSDEYCAEVKHTCVSQWYAEANKKDICERFEPHSECVGERQKKRFCIDRYAWPNRAGERPEVMNNFYQAQVKCAALGRRLCTESEWSMACEGPEHLPFPYGYERDPNKCNGDREWDAPNMKRVAQRDSEELARLWQGVPSGSQPLCVSGYGVHDLPGNNDEVASSETNAANYRGRYDSVTTGGPWYKGVRNQCRPKIYTHDEGFYYYYLGFRCCSEPDQLPTDPRAPKQVARGWDFVRVERLAGFDRAQMQEKLQLKREGKCNCPENAKLCRTMCGTLLGSKAKDVVLGTPRAEPNPPRHIQSVSSKQQSAGPRDTDVAP